jgi:hypothetical protein
LAHDFGIFSAGITFMSEFISICPKCRQRILCDTAYVGNRVACPVCLQEITMPEPPAANENSPPNAGTTSPARNQPPTPTPGHAAPAYTPPPTAAAAKTGKKFPMLAVVVSAVVLILAVAAGIMVLQGRGKTDAQAQAEPQPQAATSKTSPSDSILGCKALWNFDQGVGTVVMDVSGNGNDAIQSGSGAIWTADAKVGACALKLSKSSFAQSSGPVVNTANSFTAAAWVKFDVMSKKPDKSCQTVLSIDGNVVSGFYLQLVAGEENKFSFTRQDNDGEPSTATRAMSASAAVVGRWYHIAAVYDASKKTMALYVDGKLQEIVPHNSAWQATGSTAIGRGRYFSRNVDFMNGTVDDARIYDRALSPSDIQALASKRNTPN